MASPSQVPTWPPVDIPRLIDQSRPGGSARRLAVAVPVIWAVVLAAAVTGKSGALQSVLAFFAIGATAAVSLGLRAIARAAGREQAALGQLEDRVALKQAGPALVGLTTMLSGPMRQAEIRLRALLLLATTLARLDRQDDALLLYDELLDAEHVAGPGAAEVRLARAMALLRADRLYDADRAISDLRRGLGRARPAVAEASDRFAKDSAEPDTTPGGLRFYAATRLLELYRDVKTGHPADAIAAFNAERAALRAGLGHRYGEALALLAAAHDQLGRADEAAKYFADATALCPAVELIRKYSELAVLPPKYQSTSPPPRSA